MRINRMLTAEELPMGQAEVLKARPSEHERNRAHQDLRVRCQGPRLHILALDSHLLVKRQRMMAVGLPRAGQPLRNCKSECDVLPHLGGLARQAWPGTDEAHVAPKNINELRQ